MRKIETLSGILERDIEVREIGVKELKSFAKKISGVFKKNDNGDLTINFGFFSDNLEYSLKNLTDIKDKEIEQLSGRDVIAILKKVKELNKGFLQDLLDLANMSDLVDKIMEKFEIQKNS